MSLNKRKAWPMENSKDVLKIDKKCVTTKIGSCDQFFCWNKIFQTQQSWISIPSTYLSYWPFHVPSTRYQMMSIAEIWLGTRQKSAHANTTQMALSMCSSTYCSTFAPLFFLYFWVVVVFLDSLTFYFYFSIFFLHLGAQKN